MSFDAKAAAAGAAAALEAGLTMDQFYSVAMNSNFPVGERCQMMELLARANTPVNAAETRPAEAGRVSMSPNEVAKKKEAESKSTKRKAVELEDGEEVPRASSKLEASKQFAQMFSSAAIPSRKKTVGVSVYMRFKAKLKEHHDITDTSVVKYIWNKSARKDYLALKREAEAEKERDESNFPLVLEKWIEDATPVAKAHLEHLTTGGTPHDLQSAVDKIDKVIKENQGTGSGGSSQLLEKPAFRMVYDNAKSALKRLKTESEASALVEKLKNCTPEELFEHAKLHARLVADSRARAQVQTKQEAEGDKIAVKLQDEVVRNLKSQMVYTDSSLKYGGKTITYRRSGVTPRMFQKAFGVGTGKVLAAGGGKKTPVVKLDGHLCGNKALRYGSYLEIEGDITVKLANGSELVATATYGMSR